MSTRTADKVSEEKTQQERKTEEVAEEAGVSKSASKGKKSRKIDKRSVSLLDEEGIRKALLKQFEVYFSTANLWRDQLMQKEIAKSPERYVQLSFLAGFGKVKALTEDVAVIVQALEPSAELELSDDKTMVRRVTKLPPPNPTRDGKRVIYVDNLPEGSTAESVAELFSSRGKVVKVTPCVRIGEPEPVEDDLKNSKDFTSVFVEFERKCMAKKAVQQITAFNKMLKRQNGIISAPSTPGFNPMMSPPMGPLGSESPCCTPHATRRGLQRQDSIDSTASVDESALAKEGEDVEVLPDEFIGVYVMNKFAYLKRQSKKRASLSNAASPRMSNRSPALAGKRGSMMSPGAFQVSSLSSPRLGSLRASPYQPSYSSPHRHSLMGGFSLVEVTPDQRSKRRGSQHGGKGRSSRARAESMHTPNTKERRRSEAGGEWRSSGGRRPRTQSEAHGGRRQRRPRAESESAGSPRKGKGSGRRSPGGRRSRTLSTKEESIDAVRSPKAGKNKRASFSISSSKKKTSGGLAAAKVHRKSSTTAVITQRVASGPQEGQTGFGAGRGRGAPPPSKITGGVFGGAALPAAGRGRGKPIAQQV